MKPTTKVHLLSRHQLRLLIVYTARLHGVNWLDLNGLACN